jgi:hypothetical protein
LGFAAAAVLGVVGAGAAFSQQLSRGSGSDAVRPADTEGARRDGLFGGSDRDRAEIGGGGLAGPQRPSRSFNPESGERGRYAKKRRCPRR